MIDGNLIKEMILYMVLEMIEHQIHSLKIHSTKVSMGCDIG